MDFLEKLHEMTVKEPNELSDEEKAFIRARSYYLTNGESKKFKDILEPKKEATKKEEPKKVTPVTKEPKEVVQEEPKKELVEDVK